MKKRLRLFLVPLIVLSLACNAEELPGYMVPGGTNTPALGIGKNAGTPGPQAFIAGPITTSTPIISPTVTINYQETAIVADNNADRAQETAQAANVVIAGFTAQYNSEQSAIQIAEAERAKAEAESRIISVNATASFAPTALYLTGTAAASKGTEVVQKQEAFEKQPTIIVALTKANMTESMIMSDNAVRWAGAAFIMIMCVFAVIRLISLLLSGGNSLDSARAKLSGSEQDSEGDSAEKDMPFESLDESENNLVRINPNIPMPLPVFLQLADGVVEDKKTLVFRDWLDTPAYKYMNDFRVFMRVNRMVEPSRGGELNIIKKGLEFLTFAHVNNQPPPPYRCAL